MVMLIARKTLFFSSRKSFRTFTLFLKTLLAWYSVTANKDKTEGADDGDHYDQDNVRSKIIYRTSVLFQILLTSSYFEF